jgi:hypothetical protein
MRKEDEGGTRRRTKWRKREGGNEGGRGRNVNI